MAGSHPGLPHGKARPGRARSAALQLLPQAPKDNRSALGLGLWGNSAPRGTTAMGREGGGLEKAGCSKRLLALSFAGKCLLAKTLEASPIDIQRLGVGGEAGPTVRQLPSKEASM